jgi:tungstate transport system ATP-binding protein
VKVKVTEVYKAEAKKLRKEYGGRCVLEIEQLGLPAGKITGIMGPSGAGKSTLLRLLNLLEEPSGGEINLFAAPVPKNKDLLLGLRRRMVMVFQKPVLLDTSVFENVAFGLKARGIDREEINGRVGKVLSRVGLAALARQRARTLSGGEAQRVALARAVVLQPEILFLDEPTANLDPANVELLEEIVMELNATQGTTVAVVTHNLFQARRLAEEVLFLCQGELVEAGPTRQIFNSPRDQRTAAFIEGRMVY